MLSLRLAPFVARNRRTPRYTKVWV